MTFDLFANLDAPATAPTPPPAAALPPPAAAPRRVVAAAPAPAPALADPPAPAPKLNLIQFPMTPMPGEVNRWLYKGEIVTYDSHKLSVPGRGRWANVEGIGRPSVRGDSHADICRWIDERQAAGA